jgi:hypothetical protein
VVNVVLAAEPTAEARSRPSNVHIPVKFIVDDVAENETGKGSPHSLCTERTAESEIRQSAKNERYGRRHDQPRLVPRGIVMYAVNDERDARRLRADHWQMKDQAMQPILGQSPDQVTANQAQGGESRGLSPQSDEKCHAHDRQVKERGGERMDA